MGARESYFREEFNAQGMFPTRLIQPAEIAAAICFLLKQMMNAVHLPVNAGWR